jgi:hypothetical protein
LVGGALVLGANPAQNVEASHWGCPGTNPCGVGWCTNWRYCSPEDSGSYNCYRPISCPGGGTTCGSCPSASSSSSSGAPPPPPPPPPCVVSNPAAALLNAPADGALIPSNRPTLSWTTRSWGNGCPNNNSLAVHFKIYDGVSCNNGAWSAGALSVAATSIVLQDLRWNTTYCWRIVKDNGPRITVSAIRRFTTGTSSVLNSFSFSGGNKCVGSNYTGRLTGNSVKDSEINNPLTYDISGSKTEAGGTLQEVVVMLISNAYLSTLTAALQPVDGNNDYLFLQHAVRFAHDPTNKRNAGLRVGSLESGTGSFATVNTTANPYYGTGVTSGGVTNAAGTIRLSNLNTATGSRVVFAGMTADVRTIVQYLNTYASTPLNVYVAVIERKTDGILTSHVPYPGTSAAYDDNLILQRVSTWGIDMTPPTVAIADPVFNSPTDYNISWNISDNNPLSEIRSYCYFLAPGNAVVQDTTAGLPIVLDSIVKGFDTSADNLITTPAPGTDNNVPDMPGNCLVSSPGLTNRNYQLTAGALTAPLGLEGYAKDVACNVTVGTQNSNPPTPWIVAFSGSISANGGISNIEVPTSSANLADIVIPLTGNSFLSTFMALSGTVDNATPASNISKVRTYSSNYFNQAISPTDYGYSSWYDLVRASVTNSGATITPYGSNNINANLTAFYGLATTGLRRYYQHTGNVTIQTNLRCNMKAVIFIDGNLTITPNFLNTAGNACVFVVKGDITIGVGAHASTGLGINAVARHDRVEGMFITNGTFNVLPDERVSPQVNDALNVVGMVYATTVTLGRRLDPAQTPIQPSEVFEYDPMILFLYRDILKVSEFSLREY